MLDLFYLFSTVLLCAFDIVSPYDLFFSTHTSPKGPCGGVLLAEQRIFPWTKGLRPWIDWNLEVYAGDFLRGFFDETSFRNAISLLSESMTIIDATHVHHGYP